jgi:Cyclin, N-terminal domain
MVDLVERINVLLKQEFCSYRTEDYLDPDFQHKLIADDVDIVDQQRGSPSCSKQSSGSTSTSGINEVWREKICEWSYQVIDHYDFSREVVGIALSYLDRYLSKRSVNKKHFQLLAMTCLYLAIKIYEPGTISMKSIIGLSRGYFVVEQMVEMEMAVLR